MLLLLSHCAASTSPTLTSGHAFQTRFFHELQAITPILTDGIVLPGDGGRDRLDRMQARRKWYAELDEQCLGAVAQLADLLDTRVAAFVLDDLDRTELGDQVAPCQTD